MRLRLFALFGLVFLGLYGSANLLTSLHSWRWPMPPTRWPFQASWSAVYLSLDLLLPLAFWRVRTERLGAFTAALLIATLVAWPFFLLFPLAAIPPPGAAAGSLFQLADRLNLEANFFPSLHVAYALLAAAFLTHPAAWLWGLLIAVSTLLTHQHYTMDVVAGGILAAVSWRWALGRGRLESVCLSEAARCAARHRRYALIAVALVVASVPRWRERRLARVGFCYLQHLDDLLDGQLACQGEPEDVASEHQRALLGKAPFPDSPLGWLGQSMAEDLRARQGIGLAVEVIEEMKLDRRRVREGLLLEETELNRHLERTFELSLDLMLLAAGSSLTSARVPHLAKALGWCSIYRDYAEDQSLGLINVPAEIWSSGGTEGWFALRHAQVLEQLERARGELAVLGKEKGVGLLGVFLRSVERYAAREGAGRIPRNSAPCSGSR